MGALFHETAAINRLLFVVEMWEEMFGRKWSGLKAISYARKWRFLGMCLNVGVGMVGGRICLVQMTAGGERRGGK